MEGEGLSTRPQTRHTSRQTRDSCTNGSTCDDEMPNRDSGELNASPATSTEDKGKGSRSSSRKRKSGLIDGVCPVCGITVRPGELEQHFRYEVQQIDQIVRRRRVVRDSGASYALTKERERESKGKRKRKTTEKRKRRRTQGDSSDSSESPSDGESDESVDIDGNLMLMEVRANRHARERKKELLQNPVCNPDTMLCPVCFLPLIGSEVDRNRHVENCLTGRPSTAASAATNAGAEDSVDVDGDGLGQQEQREDGEDEGEGDDEDQYEVYEWMGETRVRAVSLVPGGYQGLGYQTTSSRRSNDVNDEDDIDLDVDGDETEEFGAQQYTEDDVIARCPSRSSQDTGDVGYEDHVNDNLMIEACLGNAGDCNGDKTETEIRDSGKKQIGLPNRGIQMVVESLKSRVRELEEMSGDGRGRLKCQICMGAYSSPLVSIQCWHVHCEDCWMKTLASKKLCPQCQMITAPSQLRKIYL